MHLILLYGILIMWDKYEINQEGENIMKILLHIQINIIASGFT